MAMRPYGRYVRKGDKRQSGRIQTAKKIIFEQIALLNGFFQKFNAVHNGKCGKFYGQSFWG